MRLGFALPQFGALGQQGARVAEFAAEVERLGAHSLWVGDRLLAPVAPSVGYGGTDTVPEQFRSRLDPLAVLTAAATATSRVTLGTNVLNLPWYPPAILARSLTTVDVISGGRLLCGFGIGWSPEEYQAAGIPFGRRGARLDEGLDALESFWSASPASHDGRMWTVQESYFDLKPVQRPRPPIYLGGMSEGALHRVGKRADGWLPAWVVPRTFSAMMFRRARQIIQRGAEEVGRAEKVPEVLRANVRPGTSVRQIVDFLGEVAEGAGIEEAFVDPMYLANDVDEALELARELLGLIG
jgi:probable F420-dependent oxidoreductase